ncbi:MAG: hypothetical protein K2X27_01500 [Candidatus Obscuribacterales bacterium]|nr:hypothetical protein [Candidatus Obscuribacterales bacterium]
MKKEILACMLVISFGASSCGVKRSSKIPTKNHSLKNSLDYADSVISQEKPQNKRSPTQESIDEIFDKAKMVRIVAHRFRKNGKMVFRKQSVLEASSPIEIESLKKCLLIGDFCSFPFSSPLLSIELFSENGPIGCVDCVGYSKLRMASWVCEAHLVNPEALSKWLLDRGVTVLNEEKTFGKNSYARWCKDHPSTKIKRD